MVVVGRQKNGVQVVVGSGAVVRPLRKGDWGTWVGVKDWGGHLKAGDAGSRRRLDMEWQARTVTRASCAVGYLGHGECGYFQVVSCCGWCRGIVVDGNLVVHQLQLASWAGLRVSGDLGSNGSNGNYITGPNPIQGRSLRSRDAHGRKIWVPKTFKFA